MTAPPAPDVAGGGRSAVWIAGVAIALVVAVCIGLLVGDRVAGASPSNDSVDAGFARDMQIHHTQAVEMSYAVIVATEDQDVRQIAFDIMTSQQAQVGRMSGWLDAWDLPAYSSAPGMAWMDSGHTAGEHDTGGTTGDDAVAGDGVLMPGMATDTEVQELRELTGRDAEIRYLQLMIDHHRGGIEMAAYAADHAEDDEVRLIADRMAASQEAEIDAMNDMLVERGADPV